MLFQVCSSMSTFHIYYAVCLDMALGHINEAPNSLIIICKSSLQTIKPPKASPVSFLYRNLSDIPP